MKTLKEFLRQNQILLMTWLTGIILVLQVMNLHTYVVQGTDHLSVVASNDDDAGTVLAKTVKTRWWKDNGWVLYGPAFFRLNHTVHYFWQRTAVPHEEDSLETWQRTAHHAVLTLSLLSIVAAALIIACHLLTLWWQRFLCTFGLVAAFTSIPTFAEFVLRAHPDMMFVLVCVAATALTVRMLMHPAEKLWFWLSAVLWGISVSVKMTISLCVPGFVLLFVPPFTKANFKRGFRYLGIMLLAYFLVGFPQTIVLDRPFKSIAKMNSISVPPTLASVTHWLELYFHHLWPVLFVVALAALDFDRRRWEAKRAVLWRVWAFALTPFVLLLGKNLLVIADHYTVGFVGIMALTVAMFFPFPRLFKKDEYSFLRGALFFSVILALFGSTPEAMQVALDKRLVCREPTREFHARVGELYKQGLNIWVDPYTPFVTYAPKDRVEVSWEKTWSGYARGNWQVMAFNRNFVSNFVAPGGPSDYTKADIPAWPAVREFYMPFAQGEEAKTPEGHVFKKVYQNSCGHEIWLKQ